MLCCGTFRPAAGGGCGSAAGGQSAGDGNGLPLLPKPKTDPQVERQPAIRKQLIPKMIVWGAHSGMPTLQPMGMLFPKTQRGVDSSAESYLFFFSLRK